MRPDGYIGVTTRQTSVARNGDAFSAVLLVFCACHNYPLPDALDAGARVRETLGLSGGEISRIPDVGVADHFDSGFWRTTPRKTFSVASSERQTAGPVRKKSKLSGMGMQNLNTRKSPLHGERALGIGTNSLDCCPLSGAVAVYWPNSALIRPDLFGLPQPVAKS